MQLSVLRQDLAREESNKWDMMAKVKDIQMDGAGHLFCSGYIVDRDGVRQDRVINKELQMTDAALSSFFNRLSIPAAYAKRTPNDILQPHIDFWKNEMNQESELLIRNFNADNRTYTRGILTSRYGIADNLEVLDAFIEGYGSDDMQVRVDSRGSYSETMRIRVTDKEPLEIGIDPFGSANPYFAGIDIANSEIGGASISLDASIWEQWCTNGAIRRLNGMPILRRKHISSGFDRNFFVRDVESTILNAPALANQSIIKFVDSQNEHVRDAIIALYNIIKSNKSTFSEFAEHKAYEALIARPGDTRYHVASAITKAAQGGFGSDRRVAMEVLGGQIIFDDLYLDTRGDLPKIMERRHELQDKFRN